MNSIEPESLDLEFAINAHLPMYISVFVLSKESYQKRITTTSTSTHLFSGDTLIMKDYVGTRSSVENGDEFCVRPSSSVTK